MVDGNSVHGDERVFRPLSKRSSEIENIFDCGWVGVDVANGWDLREALWGLNVKVEGVELCGLGN